MGKLTEKELLVESLGSTKIELFAEYDNGRCSAVYALIDIDGARLSGSDSIGYPVYKGDKLTSFFMALLTTLEYNLAHELDQKVRGLIAGEYGHD